MKTETYFLVLILLVGFSSFAQKINMNGIVLNAQNKNPVEFVNIGILERNQGTITNSKGEFHFAVSKKFAGDSITISHLNYDPVKILVENFKDRTVYLEPKTSELEEVVVTNKKIKTRRIGVKSYGKLISMRVMSKNNDIVEAAQRINIHGKEVKVKAINFAIRKWSKLNGVKVRINFYENIDNTPNKTIVQKNIVVDIPTRTKSDWIRIDLSENDIYISQDFFVGIEFIPNFENPTIVDLGGILTKGKGYRRENSLGKWTKLNGGASINVEVEY